MKQLIVAIAVVMVASCTATPVPSVLERVNPYIMLSWRVDPEELRRALNNPNLIIDTFDGSAWLTMTLEDNFIDFGPSGVLDNVSFVANTREIALRSYGRMRNPNGDGYLKGIIGAFFNHANPPVCANTVALIKAVWGVSCGQITLDYERKRVRSKFHMTYTHPDNGAQVNALITQGRGIREPTEGLIGFITDPERSWEFGWNPNNSTTHITRHDPFVIFDIHEANVESFSSSLISRLSNGKLADRTEFSQRGTALWTQRFDEPFPDHFIIPGQKVNKQ